MAIKNPIIKRLIDALYLEKPTAQAVRWIMRNYPTVPEVFTVCGWLDEEGASSIAYKRLKPFEDILRDVWNGPTNIPRGTIGEALRMIDKLIDTNGVENEVCENLDGDQITLDYCNAGDMFAPTLYYSTADDAFCLGDWTSCIELYEANGYRRLESHEKH
jgi:hypothetical protein